jgi:hypothetical protein
VHLALSDKLGNKPHEVIMNYSQLLHELPSSHGMALLGPCYDIENHRDGDANNLDHEELLKRSEERKVILDRASASSSGGGRGARGGRGRSGQGLSKAAAP